ncbi:hypothetical protein M758_2G087600 [Ceratodon purpureus]|nr:hypothetical protein M758_2G087600 [Ceratodon purpureus]
MHMGVVCPVCLVSWLWLLVAIELNDEWLLAQTTALDQTPRVWTL